MQDAVQGSTQSPYAYPLLIKQLLHTPFIQAPEQEIVYRGELRMTYTTLRERIARLANGLNGLGVRHGSTVAVMDWDSHRYLESYFAVPMMGAVLQTVNVRLSEAEIAYTINHAGAEVLFVHTDFLPVVKRSRISLKRSAHSCGSTSRTVKRARTPLRSPRNTRQCSRRARRATISLTSTRTPAPRRFTRREPPACPRVFTSRTANWSCTPSR